ncbi:MAG: glycosyltransferase [Candidatus Fermentibacteraceae bacterium]
MRKLLFLSYTFPPQTSGAVPVILNLLKYLPMNGWEMLPLVAKNPRCISVDTSLAGEVPAELKTTFVPMFDPLASFGGGYRNDGRAQNTRTSAGPVSLLKKKLSRFLNNYVLIPDRVITWAFTAVPAGVSLVRREHPDVIVSHGPHHSTHVIARVISWLTGVPHVMYFGDLWTGDSYMSFESSLNLWIEKRLERFLLRSSSGMIASTPGSLAVLRGVTGDRQPPGFVLYNAYDPDRLPRARIPRVSEGRFILATFTGNFWAEHSPKALFEGLSLFFKRFPDAPLRLRMAGTLEPQFLSMPVALGISDRIEMAGVIPFSRIVEFQAESDLLVVSLPPRPGSEVKCSSKLAEYLASGVPVLAIAPEGELTGWVREFRAGYVSPPEPVEIASTLEVILNDWKSGRLTSSVDLDSFWKLFDARRVVAGLADYLEHIVEKGARG